MESAKANFFKDPSTQMLITSMRLADQHEKYMSNPKEIIGIFPTGNRTKYLKTLMLPFLIIQPSILGAGVWKWVEMCMSYEPMTQL